MRSLYNHIKKPIAMHQNVCTQWMQRPEHRTRNDNDSGRDTQIISESNCSNKQPQMTTTTTTNVFANNSFYWGKMWKQSGKKCAGKETKQMENLNCTQCQIVYSHTHTNCANVQWYKQIAAQSHLQQQQQ